MQSVTKMEAKWILISLFIKSLQTSLEKVLASRFKFPCSCIDLPEVGSCT